MLTTPCANVCLRMSVCARSMSMCDKEATGTKCPPQIPTTVGVCVASATQQHPAPSHAAPIHPAAPPHSPPVSHADPPASSSCTPPKGRGHCLTHRATYSNLSWERDGAWEGMGRGGRPGEGRGSARSALSMKCGVLGMPCSAHGYCSPNRNAIAQSKELRPTREGGGGVQRALRHLWLCAFTSTTPTHQNAPACRKAPWRSRR
jgi:hypothetical protein